MLCKPDLVLDRPREVADWVCARIPGMEGCLALGFVGVGVQRRGRMVGGFLFHEMQEDRGSVMLSGAGTGAFLVPEVIDCLRYIAFDVMCCAHIATRNSSENHRAHNALLRAGFRLEGVQRRAWDGVHDAHIYGINPEDMERGRHG